MRSTYDILSYLCMYIKSLSTNDLSYETRYSTNYTAHVHDVRPQLMVTFRAVNNYRQEARMSIYG